jgi:hypothetical protein
MGHGHLTASTASNESASPADTTGSTLGRVLRPTGLLLDDEDLSEASPDGLGMNPSFLSSPSSPEEDVKQEAKVEEDSDDSSDDGSSASGNAAFAAGSSNSGASSSGDGLSAAAAVDPDSLPSAGSALHFSGECKRCNFFPKGRCQNGKDCSFCHYPHDKRKASRQEKRERRAAWLEQNGELQHQEEAPNSAVGEDAVFWQQPHKVGPLLPDGNQEAAQYSSCLLLQKQRPPQGRGFRVYQDEDVYSDETLAYSVFPGLPPILSTKLPALLPGTMEMLGQSGPALPPGLPVPGRATEPWQPEAEVSPAASLLSMGQTAPGGLLEQHSFQMISSAPLAPGGNTLSTVPTPLATSPVATPLPTPVPTPTAGAAMLVSAEAAEATATSASTGTSTATTQTSTYMCRRCEADGDKAQRLGKQGHQWARDELLRLRDRLAKLPEACEAKNAVLFRTESIVVSGAL